MPRFLERFSEINADVTSNAGFYKGLATAMLELGGVVGALINSWVADKFSRRRAMQVGVVVFVIGAIIQTTSPNYTALTIGRFIGGFGVGMLAMVAPVYMGEISPAEARGSLLVLEEWFIVVGAITAFWLTYGTRYIDSEWSFRLPFLLQIIPALYLGAAAIWMPPSPRWLAQKGRDQEALAILSKLRRLPMDDPSVQAEWYDIQVDAQFQRSVLAKHHHVSTDRRQEVPFLKDMASFLDLFKAHAWKRTACGVALVFFQQFVGISKIPLSCPILKLHPYRISRSPLSVYFPMILQNPCMVDANHNLLRTDALIYYAPTIFLSIGLSYERALLMSGIMNIIQLVGVTASIPLMDRLGRRPLLMLGAIGMLASQLCLAIEVGLYQHSWPSHSAQGWVGVAFIWWYMIAFGISWGPIPWSMPAEIFPSSLRSKGTAFSQACQWFFNFVIGLVTPPMIQNISYGTYIFFAVFCVLSFFWSWLLAPETKQRTLEEMDHVFGDHAGEADEEMKENIRSEIMGQGQKSHVGVHGSSSDGSRENNGLAEKARESEAFVERL